MAELAQADYAYEAANEGDLSLSEGEKLRILPFSPELEAQYGALGEGWVVGESVASGQRGVCPEGYVRRLGPELGTDDALTDSPGTDEALTVAGAKARDQRAAAAAAKQKLSLIHI